MRTPKVVVFRTRLLAATVAIDVWLLPPVPAMNSGIPFAASSWPLGFCGAKRS